MGLGSGPWCRGGVLHSGPIDTPHTLSLPLAWHRGPWGVGSGAQKEESWVPEWPPGGEPPADQEHPRARNTCLLWGALRFWSSSVTAQSPSLTRLQPQRPSFCFSNMPCSTLPLGLCMCYPLWPLHGWLFLVNETQLKCQHFKYIPLPPWLPAPLIHYFCLSVAFTTIWNVISHLLEVVQYRWLRACTLEPDTLCSSLPLLFTAVWFRASNITSLCRYVPICKMGPVIELS